MGSATLGLRPLRLAYGLKNRSNSIASRTPLIQQQASLATALLKENQ